MSSWKKIAANTIYQLIGRGMAIIIGIAIVALITRSLGTAGYGVYVLATTIPALFFLLTDFGLNAVYLREVAKDDRHLKKFGSLLGLRLTFSLLFFSLAASYVLFFSPYPPLVKGGITLGLLAIFAQSIFTSLNALFQHNLRYNLSVLAEFISWILELSLVVLIFFLGLGFLFFVGAWVLSFFAAAGFAFLLSFKLKEGPIIRLWRRRRFLSVAKGSYFWDSAWAKRLITSAFPLGLMLVFAQINGKADVFLLSLLDQPESLGIYGLAYKVFENLLFAPLFFVNALYPVMLKDHQLSLQALWDRLGKGVLIMLAAGFVFTLLAFLFAPLAVFILGGESFSSSILVLQLLSFGLPLFFVSVPLQWFLITVGKEKILPLIYGLAAFSNVAINSIFIPKFSYLASIFATLFSEALIFILLLSVVGRLWLSIERSR